MRRTLKKKSSSASQLTVAAPPPAAIPPMFPLNLNFQELTTPSSRRDHMYESPFQEIDMSRPRTLKKKASASPSTPFTATRSPSSSSSEINWGYTGVVYGGPEERSSSQPSSSSGSSFRKLRQVSQSGHRDPFVLDPWPSPLRPPSRGTPWGSEKLGAHSSETGNGMASDSEIARRMQEQEYQILASYNSVMTCGAPRSSSEDLALATRLSLIVNSVDEPTPDFPSKGKGRATYSEAPPAYAPPAAEFWEPNAICGICGDEFRRVFDPIQKSLAASGSSISYGLSLACPATHEYCLDCMTSYVRTKLEAANSSGFPIRCPECPRTVAWEMDDEVAKKVLGQDLLDVWFFQKLVISVSSFYCPNSKCSAPIAQDVDDPNLTQAECPSCHISMCFSCRTPWHEGVSCEYNKSPQKEVESEKLLKQLAEKEQWRRCPKCHNLVERTAGCQHMTCRCGYQYCHLCGSLWKSGCTCRGGCKGIWIPDDTWKVKESSESSVDGAKPRKSRWWW
ncbi:hypothetical protein FRB94_002259 [Tulasnella sp. JGI-2019a]|nr:hypothetical protein FRB93_004069 [Tulasnella sp. JGI-2019a]KAG9004583.1 hypothetical protein FRB94_002259 [Tulasnella sp. JGI-2019a]KAG9031141.1 hypothetical protein FRB95_003115 [Tulasnella sp. JGI-2019a]